MIRVGSQDVRKLAQEIIVSEAPILAGRFVFGGEVRILPVPGNAGFWLRLSLLNPS